MGIELAKALVSVRGDASKFAQDIRGAEPMMVGAVDRVAGRLKTMMFGLGAALFGRSALFTAGRMEQTEIAFRTLIGDAQEAKDTIKDLTDFASKTPFEIEGIFGAARGLIQFGERGKELRETMEFLGNAAAGTSTDFKMLALIYNQVRGAGKLLTQDFRQMSTRGVISLKDIAEHFGKTEQEASKMISTGKVGFKDLRDILKGMSAEGGRFFNLMQEQSKSFIGRFNEMKDSFTKLQIELGKRLFPVAKKVLDQLRIGIDILGKRIDQAIKFFTALNEQSGGMVTTLMKVVAGLAAARIAFGVLSKVSRLLLGNWRQLAATGLIATITILTRRISGATRAINAFNRALKRSTELDQKMLNLRQERFEDFSADVDALEAAGKNKQAGELLAQRIDTVKAALGGLQQRVKDAKNDLDNFMSENSARRFFEGFGSVFGIRGEKGRLEENIKAAQARAEAERGILKQMERRLKKLQEINKEEKKSADSLLARLDQTRIGFAELGKKAQDLLAKPEEKKVEEKILKENEKQNKKLDQVRVAIEEAPKWHQGFLAK